MRAREWRQRYYTMIRAMFTAASKVDAEDRLAFANVVQELVLNNSRYACQSPNCESMISYAVKRERKFDENARTETTIGRFLNRRMGFKYDTTKFATVYAAIITHTVSVRIVRGDEIRVAYQNRVGGVTCMTGRENANLISLYVENPDKVGLAILKYKDSKKTRYARALWWTCDDGTKVLDRIYPDDNGPQIQMFRNWAKINDGQYREKLHAPSREYNRLSDGSIREVTLKCPSNGQYPYMDTFCFAQKCEHKGMMVFSNSSDTAEFLMQKTNGGFSEYGAFVCVICGQRLDEDDVYYVGNDVLCQDCAYEHAVECSHCGTTIYFDDATSVGDSLYCDTCIDDYFRECEICGELVHNSYIYEVKGGQLVCDYCLENKFGTCDGCGEFVPNDELFNIKSSDKTSKDPIDARLCEDCFDEEAFECDGCCQLVFRTELHRVGERNYCNWCFHDGEEFCEKCDKILAISEINVVDEMYYVCDDCAEKMRKEKEVA